MTAIAGWTIICAGFSLLSAGLLWPAYRLLHRRFAQPWQARCAYAAATAGCAIMLWLLVPLIVGVLFGRAAH